jgi:DNA-binding response OmpR family regulator
MTRVLIVDDDQSIVRMLRLTLRISGFEVQTATNGLEALQLLERESTDAIILDLNMPVMTGEELLISMRERGMRTPVIVTSGEPRCNPLRLGANAFIPKPFRPDAVVDALGFMLTAEDEPRMRNGTWPGSDPLTG